MDAEWFKATQKRKGVTQQDVAEKIGRTRTVVSHMLSGRRRFTFEDAKAFSDLLDEPLSEVLQRAGIANEQVAQQLAPGFSDSDAAPWIAPGGYIKQKNADILTAFGADKNGVDIWQCKSSAMALAGILSGDYMAVDSNASERARRGDTVIAQIYDNSTGTASTILRRYEPPVLVAATQDQGDWGVKVVDFSNVVIRGVVTASWRLAG